MHCDAVHKHTVACGWRGGDARLYIDGCTGGIDGNVELLYGTLTIAASTYSIYGTLNTESYSSYYAYGGKTEDDSVPVDLVELNAATNKGWGYTCPYIQIGSEERFLKMASAGEIVTETGTKTTISVNTSALPEETAEVIVAQYRYGQLIDIRVVELGSGDNAETILLTFGTDEDAEYCLFALDTQLAPLMRAYDIEL